MSAPESRTHNLKIDDKHYMQQVIEPDNTNEQASLLRAKQDLLNIQQIELDQQTKIFWLELFAMFIFIYGSTCSKQYTGVDLAFFTGIMMAIPICAKQTGANLNPAVSYSQLLKNDSTSTYSLLWLYFKAQAAGAIISMIATLVLNDVHRSPLYPATDSSGQVVKMILSEAIGVFILIFFVLLATGPFTFVESSGAKYFYIAVFVYIGRRFAVVSGNQINFALTLSQAFVGIPECDFQGFRYLFIWLIGDALGVYIGAQFYNLLLEPTISSIYIKRKAAQQSRLLNEESIQLKDINKK